MISVVHFFQLLRQSGDPWITLLVQPDHVVRLTVMRLHTHTSTKPDLTKIIRNYIYKQITSSNKNIATGKTSQAITPFHYYFNFYS